MILHYIYTFNIFDRDQGPFSNNIHPIKISSEFFRSFVQSMFLFILIIASSFPSDPFAVGAGFSRIASASGLRIVYFRPLLPLAFIFLLDGYGIVSIFLFRS